MESTNQVKDGAYLMYVKDGQMYPVVMDESQHQMLQLLAQTFGTLKLAPFPQEAIGWQELKKRGLY